MQKTSIIILILILGSLPLIAQEATPQIAYRLLDDFVTTKELHSGRSNKIGGGITMTVGLTLMAAAGALYLWGDDLAALFPPEDAPDWSPRTRNITCLSIAGGGLVTLGIGSMIFFTPPKDYRSEYRYIYNEEDPVVQEALAAGALYQLAEDGKRGRIISGVTNLATPALVLLITITSNMVQNRPWQENTGQSVTSFSWNLVSGFSSLFLEKSEGEKLYTQYEQTKKALLVEGNNKVALRF